MASEDEQGLSGRGEAVLAEHPAIEGINVAHLMDCREDTVLVIHEHDAPTAYKVLAERLTDL